MLVVRSDDDQLPAMTQRLQPKPFPGPRNPPFCRVCNIPHISPAVHYFPRGSNTRGNKFWPDFSEEEAEEWEEEGGRGISPSPAVEAAAASRVTLLSIIIL